MTLRLVKQLINISSTCTVQIGIGSVEFMIIKKIIYQPKRCEILQNNMCTHSFFKTLYFKKFYWKKDSSVILYMFQDFLLICIINTHFVQWFAQLYQAHQSLTIMPVRVDEIRVNFISIKQIKELLVLLDGCLKVLGFFPHFLNVTRARVSFCNEFTNWWRSVVANCSSDYT